MCALLLASSDKSNFISFHLPLPSHPVPVITPPPLAAAAIPPRPGLPTRSQPPSFAGRGAAGYKKERSDNGEERMGEEAVRASESSVS